MLQSWSQFVPQKHGRDPDTNAPKNTAVQHQRHTDFVNYRWVIDKLQLTPEAGPLQQGKIRPSGDLLTNLIRIGIENGFSIGIKNGVLINGRPASDYRIEHGIEVAVRAQIIGNPAPHRLRIAGVNTRTAKIGGRAGSQVCQV